MPTTEQKSTRVFPQPAKFCTAGSHWPGNCDACLRFKRDCERAQRGEALYYHPEWDWSGEAIVSGGVISKRPERRWDTYGR